MLRLLKRLVDADLGRSVFCAALGPLLASCGVEHASTSLPGRVASVQTEGLIAEPSSESTTKSPPRAGSSSLSDGYLYWEKPDGVIVRWTMDGTRRTRTDEYLYDSVAGSRNLHSARSYLGLNANYDIFNGEFSACRDFTYTLPTGEVRIVVNNVTQREDLFALPGDNVCVKAKTLTYNFPGWTVVSVEGAYSPGGDNHLLWRSADGQVAIWDFDLNGTYRVGHLGTIPTSWSIVDGRGDYDGDGISDILWRDTSGNLGYFKMATYARYSAWVPLPSVSPNEWTIVEAAGDYNGDGKSDIVWMHTSGAVYIWLMRGATPELKYVGTVPAGWTMLEGNTDLNKDGKGDLTWRHANGTVVVWLIDGGTPTKQEIVGTVNSSWKLVSRFKRS